MSCGATPTCRVPPLPRGGPVLISGSPRQGPELGRSPGLGAPLSLESSPGSSVLCPPPAGHGSPCSWAPRRPLAPGLNYPHARVVSPQSARCSRRSCPVPSSSHPSSDVPGACTSSVTQSSTSVPHRPVPRPPWPHPDPRQDPPREPMGHVEERAWKPAGRFGNADPRQEVDSRAAGSAPVPGGGRARWSWGSHGGRGAWACRRGQPCALGRPLRSADTVSGSEPAPPPARKCALRPGRDLSGTGQEAKQTQGHG